MKKALFLDRDGVICEALPRGKYLTSWGQFKLTNYIADLINYAKNKDYLIIVVTNQSQIAKGLINEQEFNSINEKTKEALSGKLDAVYYCPHRNEDNCDCRKPKSGMLLKAGEDFGIDFSQSFFLGDSDKDMGAGRAVGCKTIFLRNEHNAEELKNCTPNFIINSLEKAAEII